MCAISEGVNDELGPITPRKAASAPAAISFRCPGPFAWKHRVLTGRRSSLKPSGTANALAGNIRWGMTHE